MKQKVLENIAALNANIIVFDIDGTLKDLVREHKEALKKAVNGFVKGKKLRKKFVFGLDEIAMWFVKSGVLPTNGRMQRILITIYSIILCENIANFKESYKFFYEKENILFNESKELLDELLLTKEVYFVTVNKQNYNLEKQGISQDRIIYTLVEKKKKAYQRLFGEKGLDESKVVIIGDNLFDDISSAKKLGVKSLLVNNYNSNFKCFIAKILNVGM